MSLLVLCLPNSANVSSVLTCSTGAEFVTLVSYLTDHSIQYVALETDAVSVGSYCTPINFSANQFLYFQALDNGVGGVFFATVGYLVFVDASP